MFENSKIQSKKILNTFLILIGFIATLNMPIVKAMPKNNLNSINEKTYKTIKILKNNKFEKMPKNLNKLYSNNNFKNIKKAKKAIKILKNNKFEKMLENSNKKQNNVINAPKNNYLTYNNKVIVNNKYPVVNPKILEKIPKKFDKYFFPAYSNISHKADYINYIDILKYVDNFEYKSKQYLNNENYPEIINNKNRDINNENNEITRNIKNLFNRLNNKFNLNMNVKDEVTVPSNNIDLVPREGEERKNTIYITLEEETKSISKILEEKKEAKARYIKAIKNQTEKLNKEIINRKEDSQNIKLNSFNKNKHDFNNLGYFLLNIHTIKLQKELNELLQCEKEILNNAKNSLNNLINKTNRKEVDKNEIIKEILKCFGFIRNMYKNERFLSHYKQKRIYDNSSTSGVTHIDANL